MQTAAPHARLRRLRVLAVPCTAVVAALALSGPASAASTPTSVSPSSAAPITTTVSTTTQGIIMRDGGVCDPIRHMGC
jgi:hypothetical protein